MDRMHKCILQAATAQDATRGSVIAAAMQVRHTTRFEAERKLDAALEFRLLWEAPDMGDDTRIGAARRH